MKKHTERKRSMLAALMVAVVLSLFVQLGSRGRAAAVPAAACEGDACAQVTVAFDEAKGQYRALNNSADRWVRVSASNLTASASACLGPGREDYLELKSMVGPYRGEYAEPKCGAQGVGR